MDRGGEGIETMQLTLHIPQLQYHLENMEPILFNKMPIMKIAEKLRHDAQRKVFYIHEMVLCEMTFQQVTIYYENNQIVFLYSTSGTDVCQKLQTQLAKHEIPFVPLQKSFVLR